MNSTIPTAPTSGQRGLSPSLASYRDKTIPQYDFFSTEEETSIAKGVLKSTPQLKGAPFSIGFAAEGKVIDEEILLSLIQSQEKLCHNFGQKRKTIAIGVYRSDLIEYPVHFAGVDPDEAHFVPLHMEEDLTLRQICEKHPKGLEYGPIVADLPLFPLLYENRGDVLSFPPVINSAHVGAVEVGDERLFFEFSGTILDDLLLAASIMACDCADLGYTILPVLCKFDYDTPYGREITVPYYFQEPAACELDFLRKTLGEDLSDDQIISALRRMGVFAITDEERVYVTIPEYRNDFLHPVDIVEDVMIGHGLNNFEVEMPDESTVGRLTVAESFARKVKDIMVGLGYQEMIYNYLGSKREYIDNMLVDGSAYIQIANPMSENYSMCPSIIRRCWSREFSAHAPYPHSIFEIGKVAFKDPSDISGTTTRNYLGFLSAGSEADFNQLNSQLATLFYFMGCDEYKMESLEDPRFIPGRCGNLVTGSTKVGVFGEVHPAVLEKWGITVPTIACEIDLDLVLAKGL